jgi:glucose/mannose transport system permease protein
LKILHLIGWLTGNGNLHIVIAGVWQSAGFVMALFLAGLRSVEDEIVKAAKIDGAGLFTVYWKILFQ